MKLTNRQIAEAAIARLKGGASQASVCHSLAAYLISERRSKDLDGVMRNMKDAFERQDGQLELDATSARPLSPAIKKELSALFEKGHKKVIINETLDPAVIGGVKVESSQARLDLTIRRRLQRLKEMGA